jgi:hypothetical protein
MPVHACLPVQDGQERWAGAAEPQKHSGMGSATGLKLGIWAGAATGGGMALEAGTWSEPLSGT